MNSVKNMDLLDKSFDKAKASQYIIYSELSLHQFTSAIFDDQNKTFIGTETFSFENATTPFTLIEPLKEAISASKVFQLPVKHVNLSVVNPFSTFIPNVIFDKKELATYHNFNFSPADENLYFADKLINLSSHNVYSIPDFIISCFDNIQNLKIKHQSTILTEANLLLSKADKLLDFVQLNVNINYFELTIIKNGKLEFFNTFNYQTSEDFIYYLLFTLNQLNLDLEKLPLLLSGNVEKNSAIYEILNKYIKSVQFSKLPKEINTSYIFESQDLHKYYSLFNQFLCG